MGLLGCQSVARASDAYGYSFFDQTATHNSWDSDCTGPCFTPFVYESPLNTTYATADFIAFRRDWSPSLTMATSGSPDNPVLGTHDLQVVFQPGLRVVVGRRLNDSIAVEGTFLGLLQWDEIQAVGNQTINSLGTAGNLFSPFTSFGDPAAVGFDYNNFASIRVMSSMNNAEINLRQQLDTFAACFQATWVYGVRYMNVRDQFQYRTRSLEPVAAGTTNFVDVLAKNSLIGLQTGGSGEIRLARRAWLQFEFKFLLMHNDAGQQTEFTTDPLIGAGTTVTGSRSQGRVALGGDAAATLTWQVSTAIILRVGYQVIFVDGLALGADNFIQNIALITTDPTILSQDGHLAWHGPFAGVTATW